MELFDDAEFWHASLAFFGALGDALSRSSADQLPAPLIAQLLEPFWRHYRALPPLEFIATYPGHRQGFAILSGRWGVVPVFPWTSSEEINTAARKIRKAIGRTHQDAHTERRGALGAWLKLHGFNAAEIASAVGAGPAAGRRPRKRRVSWEREQELMQHELARGRTYQEAERKITRAGRRLEAPIEPALRVALARILSEQAALQTRMHEPMNADPIAHAITRLLRVGVLDPGSYPELEQWTRKLHELLGITPLL